MPCTPPLTGATQGVLHDVRLRVGVVVHVAPRLRRERSLHGGVALASFGVAAAASRGGPGSRRSPVIRRSYTWTCTSRSGRAKHPMVRLPHAQLVAGLTSAGANAGVVVDVGDHDEDVDDRLRREAGDRRRADVLDPQGGAAERSRDSALLDLEPAGPGRVVVDDHDAGHGLEPAHEHPIGILLPTHAASWRGSVRRAVVTHLEASTVTVDDVVDALDARGTASSRGCCPRTRS